MSTARAPLGPRASSGGLPPNQVPLAIQKPRAKARSAAAAIRAASGKRRRRTRPAGRAASGLPVVAGEGSLSRAITRTARSISSGTPNRGVPPDRTSAASRSMATSSARQSAQLSRWARAASGPSPARRASSSRGSRCWSLAFMVVRSSLEQGSAAKGSKKIAAPGLPRLLPRPQRLQRVVEPRLDGAQRDPQRRGDLLQVEPLREPEEHHLALGLGEGAEVGPDLIGLRGRGGEFRGGLERGRLPRALPRKGEVFHGGIKEGAEARAELEPRQLLDQV